MADEDIQNELKRIGKKLDDIKKTNDAMLRILLIIGFFMICFFLMSFIYFSGHFPPI